MSRLYPTYQGAYDDATVAVIRNAAGVAELTAHALIRRGITDAARVEAFLHAENEPLCDPLLLPDMDRAVVRIVDAIRRDERICVYGDYDADGICASAILVRTLATLGANVTRYIPSRHSEGYGLNESAIRKLVGAYVDLIITVDNGISAFDEIALCTALGVDVVVTDHHSIGASVPVCCAVVSAARKDSAYPNPHLCGAGVALKLAQALLPHEEHSEDLALAAVATVADVVPLLGENRAIVAQGLRYIGKNAGLAALLRVSGWKGQTITEQTLAFQIAPRLNASGRMSDAMHGVELLLSEERAEADRLARLLDGDNAARREAEAVIAEEAAPAIDATKRALLIAHDGWNPGVIGIVASRLTEKYHRPVILFTDQNGMLTGSGRCPEGIDLFQTLSSFSSYFVRFGGHARAAGITMLKENFAPFCEAFYASMAGYEESCFKPSCGYEEEVRLPELTLPNVRELGLLAPFGEGNPVPVYLLSGAKLTNVATMGKDGAHLSAMAVQDGAKARLVAFRQGERFETFRAAEALDIAITPQINSFRERETVELLYVGAACRETKIVDAFFVRSVYNGMDFDDTITARYLLNAEDAAALSDTQRMRELYSYWKAQLSLPGQTPESLAKTHAAEELLSLLVFLELAFFAFDRETGRIRLAEGVSQRQLTQSALYRALTGADDAKQQTR